MCLIWEILKYIVCEYRKNLNLNLHKAAVFFSNGPISDFVGVNFFFQLYILFTIATAGLYWDRPNLSIYYRPQSGPNI